MPNIEDLTTHELKTLMKEAPRVIQARRNEEKERVIQKLEELAVEHGFELRELVESYTRRSGAKPGRRSSGEAKYRSKVDPSKTWTGVGRRPAWVLEHIENGGSLEDLAIRSVGIR